MSKALDWLKDANDFLEKVPISILNYFDKLAKNIEQMAQKQIDIICRWLAWKVNIMVERKRQEIIKYLYAEWGCYMQLNKQAAPLLQKPTVSVKGIFMVLEAFLDPYLKPVKTILSFLKTLMIEIPRLAKNLAKIADALPPTPPTPNVNYHAFKLKIGTISLKDIMTNPDSMPTPEEMFPEPQRPFGKEFFNAAFDDAKKITAKDKIIYKLPESASAIGEEIHKQINEN